MKIFYNSKIAKLFTFIDGYKTIMLFGAVFTERDAISLKAEYHDKAYHNIVFEREAFDLEKYWNKHDVLRKESKGFSFLKYYGKEYYHE